MSAIIPLTKAIQLIGLRLLRESKLYVAKHFNRGLRYDHYVNVIVSIVF